MRIAVCDDDERCLNDESVMIAETAAELGLGCDVLRFRAPSELIACGEKFDIVFLDVEMEEMSGIEAAEAIHEKSGGTYIFFVTNHEGYMDEALNKHAFRFWVKPINRQRLAYGMESAVREMNSVEKYLKVSVEGKPSRVPMTDIIYACAKNKITSIVTVNGELEVREPFKNVLPRLCADFFCKSHASYCVNMNYVIRYDKENVICRSGGREYTAYMSKRCYGEFSRRFISWAGDHV